MGRGRNSYLAIGYLATHPAFSHRWVALECPICGKRTSRVGEYDKDFLAHDPSGRVAWTYLSGKKYDREAPKRGWPTTDPKVPGNGFEVYGEGSTLTAEVTVALRCNGAGCAASYSPTAACAGSVKATRDQAATHGWSSAGGEDRCPVCTARLASSTPPPTLFDDVAAAPLLLGRLPVDRADVLDGRPAAAATFSPCTTVGHGPGCRMDGCREYRYDLTRVWDCDRELICWIMLNPSTADAFQLDPTLRKCRGFAERWGYGGMLILNMFAYRSTAPGKLRSVYDPVGPDNDMVIAHHFGPNAPHRIGRVMVGWGPVGKLGAPYRPMMRKRADGLLALLDGYGVKPQCVAVTGDGSPGHPLLIPYDAPILDYSGPVTG